MKKTFEPTEGFISLYQKAEDARKKVLQYLATYTGFNESWCDKNPIKCLEYLNEKQQRKIDDLTLHAQIIKRYLWCKLYYENFDEVKDVLLDSSKIIQYNPKTKMIEVKEISAIENEGDIK